MSETDAETSSPQTRVVMRFIDEVVNGGDTDLIDDLWASDLVWEGGSLGTRHGIAAFKKTMGAGGGSGRWVDLHLTVHAVFAQGDDVVVQFTNSGQRAGRLFGVLPFTSKRGSWNGVGVYTVKDGKIARGWFVEDVVAMMRSLGIRGALNLMTSGRRS